MPSHQRRRSPLPKDYQFGDAGREPVYDTHETCVQCGGSLRAPWRPAHVNAAEQLARQGQWNVIEGDHD